MKSHRIEIGNRSNRVQAHSPARIVRRPLSAKEFRELIGDDNRVHLVVPLSLDELLAGAVGHDSLNELVDERLYGDGVSGCLVDIEYRPLWVENGLIHVEVSASAEELETDNRTTYAVSVAKRLYCTGVVHVDADSPEEAERLVINQIEKGVLQTTAIEWGDPEYEDGSFETTGDVDGA